MNHTISPNILDLNALNNNSVVKLLIFTIGKLTLALPVDRVKKVSKYQAVHGSGLSHVNLTHLAEEEVTTIDLHQKLFNVSLNSEANDGYFILTKNIAGDLLGILVSEMPTIIDVPLAQIRILPSSYRHADTLAIASHVAVIEQKDETSLTIFILDVEQLI